MTTTESPAPGSAAAHRVSVTRRIGATAGQIFAVLTDPANHSTLDGSGMLRPGGAAAGAISRAGDTFELIPEGPSETVVTEFFDCTDAIEEIRTAVDDGRAWLDAMSQTLARLASITEKSCASQVGDAEREAHVLAHQLGHPDQVVGPDADLAQVTPRPVPRRG